jgi:hypothetical protein
VAGDRSPCSSPGVSDTGSTHRASSRAALRSRGRRQLAAAASASTTRSAATTPGAPVHLPVRHLATQAPLSRRPGWLLAVHPPHMLLQQATSEPGWQANATHTHCYPQRVSAPAAAAPAQQRERPRLGRRPSWAKSGPEPQRSRARCRSRLRPSLHAGQLRPAPLCTSLPAPLVSGGLLSRRRVGSRWLLSEAVPSGDKAHWCNCASHAPPNAPSCTLARPARPRDGTAMALRRPWRGARRGGAS